MNYVEIKIDSVPVALHSVSNSCIGFPLLSNAFNVFVEAARCGHEAVGR